MENENVQQQPTYDQLATAYTGLLRTLEQTRAELDATRADNLLSRMHALMSIMEHKDCYSAKITKLAEWHLEQMLAKPKA